MRNDKHIFYLKYREYDYGMESWYEREEFFTDEIKFLERKNTVLTQQDRLQGIKDLIGYEGDIFKIKLDWD